MIKQHEWDIKKLWVQHKNAPFCNLMLQFVELKAFLKIASSFVSLLYTGDHISSTNPIEMIHINVSLVFWSPFHRSQQQKLSLPSPQRLLRLVVCCPQVSELSLHL